MGYRVTVGAEALDSLKRLDRHVSLLIRSWIDKNLDGCDDPFAKGKPLTGDRSGLWRYRFQDFRIIASIDKGRLLILVVSVGHRSRVYRR